MIIDSKTTTTISGVQIVPGKRDYPLDHKDPKVVMQLKVLRDDMRLIEFEEIIDVREPGKKSQDSERNGVADISDGKVSDQTENAGATRGGVSERRDETHKAVKLRGKNSGKKS